MRGFLSGVRVLDFTIMVAGPSGTQLLADLGAEVIKIEPPTGDPIRRTGGPTFQGDRVYYLSYNRNKKGICLDLRTQAGLSAFYDLVRISDVVFDNFRPAAMRHLHADYDTLSKMNPRIICVSSSGYGSTGPYSDRPGFDPIGQSESGLTSVTGFAGELPMKTGPAIGDVGAGVSAALAVAAALQARERTGRGMAVETSLLNAGVYLMSYHLVRYFLSGQVPPRIGNAHFGIAPYGIYKAMDGKFIALGSCWPSIAEAIGEPKLLDDARFQTLEGRLEHREVLDTVIGGALLKRTAAEWLGVLRHAGIPVSPANSVDEIERDAPLQPDSIVHVAHPRGGDMKFVNNPIRVQGADRPDWYTPPPALGQHTDEVLKGLLNYSDEQMAELARQQAANAAELESHTVKKK